MSILLVEGCFHLPPWSTYLCGLVSWSDRGDEEAGQGKRPARGEAGNARDTSEQAAYLIVRDFHAADGKRRLEVGKAQKWRPRAAGNELQK